MKVKTSELTGAALDWVVAVAKGINPADILFDGRRIYRRTRDEEGNLTGSYMTGPEFLFSKMWEAGGPIIEQSGIGLHQNSKRLWSDPNRRWQASLILNKDDVASCRIGFGPIYGPTPLIAAMRCYVSSKLGDVVEIPKELV